MPYIGNNLQFAFPSYRNIDDISGSFDGVTTSFALTVSGTAPVPLPVSSNQCLISVGGVVQRPDDSGTEGFRLSGGNIIFSSAPAALADFFGVILAGADYANAGANFPSGSASNPSITFESDLDTGLYTPGANEIGFTNGGTTSLVVGSTGQLRSGTLGSAGTPTYSFNSDPNTGIYSPGADQLAVSTGGTGRLFIDSSGRVGIGTTSPGDKLVVYNSATNGQCYIEVNNNRARNAAVKYVTTGGTWYTGASIGNDNNRFSIYESGVGDRLLINPDGSTVFYDSAEQMRIDSSGRLLVGTSTNAPSDTLFVVHGQPGNANEPAVAQLRRGGTILADYTLGQVSFADGSGNVAAHIRGVAETGWGGSGDAPGRLTFSTTADGASSPTERMRISNTGGVRLPDVYNQTIALSANVFIDTDGTLKRATSSIKYKTNVETLEDQYADAVLNCRPVWYQSTSAGDNPNWGFWGFIAEEVAEIDPRLVQWKTVEQVINEDGSRETIPLDTPEPENVAYDRFVPHLLNLIKRQQQAIEDLQVEVAALKAL